MSNSVSIRKFYKNEQGATATIVAVVLILVIFGVLSVAVDLSRTQTTYNKNQQATDAAAAGTAEFILKGIISKIGDPNYPDAFTWKPTQAEMSKYAEDILKQNFSVDQKQGIYDPSTLSVVYTVTNGATPSQKNFNVNVKACANLDTKIALAAKQDADGKMRTCTSSDAGFSLGSGKNIEIAFALDYTDSMYAIGQSQVCPKAAMSCPSFANTKAKSLVNTMNYVFDNYFAVGAGTVPIYGSIVPYTGLVNLYPYNKTMVTANNTAFSAANDPTTLNRFYNFFNRVGPDYQSPSDNVLSQSPFCLGYDANLKYVLDRIPSISGPSMINSITSASNSTSLLPFPSYRDTYEGLNGQINDNFRKSFCYNGAVAAGLDQRIEKLEGFGDGIIVTPNTPAKVCNTVFNATANSWNDSATTKSPRAHNNGRFNELHESFPIQPLTNNTELLKNVIGRYTAEGASSRFYSLPPGVTENTVIDGQGNRLNKTKWFTSSVKTSSIQGLLWAWFTVSNDWKNKWSAKSLHETFYSGLGNDSQNSRVDLPSPQNVKHIILITDGNDNDGASANNVCDAYTPTAALTDAQYNAVCNRIKSEGITIHTILFDFNGNPTSNRYLSCASSPANFHNGVSADDAAPNSLKNIMDGIFKQIYSDLISVRIVK